MIRQLCPYMSLQVSAGIIVYYYLLSNVGTNV